MAPPSKIQWSSQVVASKSKYTPLRPQFARHGTSEVATTARDKLDDQAGRSEHDLRVLVGHANTLDYLIERLHARQQSQALKQDATTEAEPSSRDAHQSIYTIPEEAGREISTEQKQGSNDVENELRASGSSKDAGEKSYFDLRGDKISPASSIVELLESGSESEGSERDDDVSSEDDVDDVDGSCGSDES